MEGNLGETKVWDAVSDGINGNPRVGKVTHGKQIGMSYIITY